MNDNTFATVSQDDEIQSLDIEMDDGFHDTSSSDTSSPSCCKSRYTYINPKLKYTLLTLTFTIAPIAIFAPFSKSKWTTSEWVPTLVDPSTIYSSDLDTNPSLKTFYPDMKAGVTYLQQTDVVTDSTIEFGM